MKVFHTVYNDWTKKQRQLLRSYNIDAEEGYSSVEIEENEKNSGLLKLLDSWELKERFVGTSYDKGDYKSSKLFAYRGSWANGYPQPEDGFGYLNLTYNLDNYCRYCGTGALQKAPFRLKKEPVWGTKKMFELNWIFDQVFVHKELYEDLFKKYKVETFPVLLYKKETVVANTLQLKLPIIDIPLRLEKQPFEVCSHCGRKKYSPQIKGFFPAFSKKIPDELHIFKCNEYFGSGGEARNNIFISKELYEALHSLKIKLDLSPVQP